VIEVITSIANARARFREICDAGVALGLVPTMGALHAGHTSLIKRARADNDRVVMSLFVNPTQYDDPADLESYPRTFEADLEKAEAAGADIVLAPASADLYPDDYRFRVTESPLSQRLEGVHRSGHFDGVLTVVLKLLNIVRPHRVYFGEKDWQQLQLVREMVDALFVETEIVTCPTVRENDGLAMSSRNVLLPERHRRLAPQLHSVLAAGGPVEEMASTLEAAGFDVDYVERWNDRVLGAVQIGKVRLIDNVRI
jgi:pantoate--beta-alanine ligase